MDCHNVGNGDVDVDTWY